MSSEIIEFMKAKATMTVSSKKSYNNTLNRFIVFCRKNNISIVKATQGDIAKYLEQFKNNKLKTRKSYRLILNGFYNWMVKQGNSRINPVTDITFKGNARTEDKLNMTKLDFEKILNRCDGMYDMSLASFLWYTGVRATELTELTIDDVKMDDNYIYVGVSKSERGNRRIPIHKNFKKLLSMYMKRRTKLETKKPWLFLTKSRNTKITYRTLLYYIKQYQEGLDIDFACHDFRRAFGTRVYNKTNDIVLAQQLLGHSSIETTRKYILGDTQRLEKFNQIDF